MNENRLDELKREYDSIPVPEELEFRVRASMEQAKKQAQPAGAVRFGKAPASRRLPPC